MRRAVRASYLVWTLTIGCGGADEDGSSGETTSVGTSSAEPTQTSTPEPTDTGDAPGPGCAAPLAVCDGQCVDLEHDPAHCGGCNTPCDVQYACVAGECAAVCGLGAVVCGPSCVQLDSDPEHCGACDRACDPGVACVAGSCAPTCPEGQQVCTGECTATASSETHCGSCSDTCVADEHCVYGRCMADAAIHHVLITGQSLSTGATSPVVSAVQPYANLSFNTGVRAGGANLTGFIPLVETWDGSQGETIASGLANMIAGQEAQSGGAYTMLVSAHGVSGQPYSVIKKGTAAFANGMAQVTAGLTLAAMTGQSYSPRAVAVVHGESDHIAVNLGYADDLLAWQSDYEADIAAITGVDRAVPMFLCQMSSFTKYGQATSRIPGLQLAAAKARPDRIYVVGPKYFMPYTDGVHLTGDGERWLGEYYAKAYRKVLIDGERWLPVQPQSVARQGSVIMIEFAVLAPPLVLDEIAVSNPGNFGFEFSDSSGATPAIVEVALAGPTSVRVTLASVPTGGNRRIRYAHTGVAGQDAGPTTGARGNLHDSDPTVSPNGYSLVNWAVHFDEPVE